MPSYYVHKYHEFGDQVLRSKSMGALVGRIGERIKVAAERIAPVGEESSFWYGPDSPSGRLYPGDYKGSFRVTEGKTGGRGSRVYARVENYAPHASAVEFGFRNTPKYRVLGRAAGVGGAL